MRECPVGLRPSKEKLWVWQSKWSKGLESLFYSSARSHTVSVQRLNTCGLDLTLYFLFNRKSCQYRYKLTEILHEAGL